MAQKRTNPTTDIYQIVTDRILEQLEQGVIPWQKPWHGGLEGAISYATGRPYSLLNQFLLGREGEYLTFKQVKELGGKVKEGAKSQMVVFFKLFPTKDFRKKKNEQGEEEMEEVQKMIPVLRYYNVFHIEDCEGVKSKLNGEKPVCTLKPVEQAEKVIADYYGREKCTLEVKKSDKAFYSPLHDSVTVPMMEQYDLVEEYYSTIFHETGHSTGHVSRLNRELGGMFGSDKYSKEELVAEMVSAFLCQKCGLDNDKAFKNSVAYIDGWAKKLKGDNKFIVSAASKAEKAVKYILTGERPTLSK